MFTFPSRFRKSVRRTQMNKHLTFHLVFKTGGTQSVQKYNSLKQRLTSKHSIKSPWSILYLLQSLAETDKLSISLSYSIVPNVVEDRSFKGFIKSTKDSEVAVSKAKPDEDNVLRQTHLDDILSLSSLSLTVHQLEAMMSVRKYYCEMLSLRFRV